MCNTINKVTIFMCNTINNMKNINDSQNDIEYNIKHNIRKDIMTLDTV